MTYFYDLGGFKLNLTWSPVWYWIVLTLFEDMMYYWEHRFDHYVRFFWAMHVTHHSSNEYNLSVGFRSSVFQPLYRIAYFLPIAFLGFRAEDIMFTYAWTQILGVLVHTQTVGKMWAPIEWLFATPSHHRVHHACNVRYLDKNMGMLLIIWDRLFGTFAKEDPNYEPIRYGLTTPLQTYHPLKLVFHEWVNIKNDLKKSKKLKDRWMYLFGPPGWSHDGSTHTSAQLRAKEAKG
jgi:sterol desaturase/sphingolipid hydroxylase (fatty acid hydroxylase superfamily)